MEPDLNDLIRQIQDWQRETFPGSSPAGAVEHVRREAIELHEAYWEVGDGARRPERIQTINQVGEEAADIVFMLAQLADLEGFSLAIAVSNKLAKNKARTWKAPDAQGVVEHVKEEGE